MWECDYPHSDSTWPQAPESFAKHFDDTVSQSDIDKISHLNAMKAFRYDPFAHRPKDKCTVAALRAEADGVTTSGIS
jgi:hypothetical protein